jgi:hypothetical protein
MEQSIVHLCESLIRDLSNRSAQKQTDKPFKEHIKKTLKFQNENDWLALCSLLDVLSDTELARENFMKFGLPGPTKIRDYGEQYLRLYGILNAVYLQKSAVDEFIILSKLPNKSKIMLEVNHLDIFSLRNILAAHTVNFLSEGEKDPHQFQRGWLDNRPIRVSNTKGIGKEYDLKELVNTYHKKICKVLFDASQKFVHTVLKNGGVVLKKYEERLELIEQQLDGAIVIYGPEEQDPFIIVIK